MSTDRTDRSLNCPDCRAIDAMRIVDSDEPTSGLDATSSLSLIKALRATAKQGITVAAVLHQPRYEMFCLFHDVLLLGKGGVR